MGIQKLWAVNCDTCKNAIDYFYIKPTIKFLKKMGEVVEGNRVFCSSKCYRDRENAD